MKKILGFLKDHHALFVVVLCFMFLNILSMAAIAYGSVTTTTHEGSGGTRTVTVEKSEESRGLIGSVFHLVGQVIVFPFKVIGSMF